MLCESCGVEDLFDTGFGIHRCKRRLAAFAADADFDAADQYRDVGIKPAAAQRAGRLNVLPVKRDLMVALECIVVRFGVVFRFTSRAAEVDVSFEVLAEDFPVGVFVAIDDTLDAINLLCEDVLRKRASRHEQRQCQRPDMAGLQRKCQIHKSDS